MKGNWKFMRTKLECKISLGYIVGLSVIFKMTKFPECICKNVSTLLEQAKMTKIGYNLITPKEQPDTLNSIFYPLGLWRNKEDTKVGNGEGQCVCHTRGSWKQRTRSTWNKTRASCTEWAERLDRDEVHGMTGRSVLCPCWMPWHSGPPSDSRLDQGPLSETAIFAL